MAGRSTFSESNTETLVTSHTEAEGESSLPLYCKCILTTHRRREILLCILYGEKGGMQTHACTTQLMCYSNTGLSIYDRVVRVSRLLFFTIKHEKQDYLHLIVVTFHFFMNSHEFSLMKTGRRRGIRCETTSHTTQTKGKEQLWLSIVVVLKVVQSMHFSRESRRESL